MVYDDIAALQKLVDTTTASLKAATDAFNEKKNRVDKTKLQAEIEAAEENIANIKKASKSDVEKYRKAIDEATAVYDNANATQAEVDEALGNLEAATKTFDS